MGAPRFRRHLDVNAVVSSILRDLAFVQTSPHKAFGYKRAAAVLFSLEQPLTELVLPEGSLVKIPGIGPATTRIILEVLSTGASPTAEDALERSGKQAEIARRRSLRRHVLSRAEVIRILDARSGHGPTVAAYRGDLQMHSVWSDGAATLAGLADACIARGYNYAAITDHSHGLKIAGGMTMAEAAAQHEEVDRLNARHGSRFRFIKGIEANIAADGCLDLSDEEAAQFELVLAAPHAKLRSMEDQTARMVAAVRNPRVHVLAHPRGRIAGSRAGVVADWKTVFSAAAAEGVAIELDGDPFRQDLDYEIASQACELGCLFALDSDAHSPEQLPYVETAIAHARLAAIPPERIVNYWDGARLLAWLSARGRR